MESTLNASSIDPNLQPLETTTSIGTSNENLILVEKLTIYITFIVSVVGLIGNACTIIVLNTRSMRKWRSSILLTALAVADFLYLLIIFLSLIDALTSKAIGLHRSLILCQTTVYITHVCSFLSANFTLSFTLQRFVAVLFPLHANKIISTRSSTLNIVFLILIGSTFYSFSFFLTSISNGTCKEDEKYPALFPLLIVDICLTFVLPFIFIVLFNCAIVYKLRKRKKLDHLFGSTGAEFNQHRKNSSSYRTNPNHHEQHRLSHSESNSHDASKNEKKYLNDQLSATGKKYKNVLDSGRYSGRFSFTRVSTMTINNESTSTNTSTCASHRQGVSQRTTKMLVICSTTFLLFNSPYSAVFLYSFISKKDLMFPLSVLRHFYFMSFCLNFFLYSLCVHRFRDEFLLLLKKCFARRCFTPKKFPKRMAS